ncbi:unnamed protein product [Lota lota]
MSQVEPLGGSHQAMPCPSSGLTPEALAGASSRLLWQRNPAVVRDTASSRGHAFKKRMKKHLVCMGLQS